MNSEFSLAIWYLEQSIIKAKEARLEAIKAMQKAEEAEGIRDILEADRIKDIWAKAKVT